MVLYIYIYLFMYVCLSVCLSVCPRVYAVYIQNRVQHRINGCANHKHVPRYSIQCLGGSVFLKTSNISSARSLVENAKWWLVNWLMLVPKAPYKWYSKITLHETKPGLMKLLTSSVSIYFSIDHRRLRPSTGYAH